MLSILGVNVEVLAVSLLIGLTKVLRFMLFLVPSDSSIITSSVLATDVFSVNAIISPLTLVCTALISVPPGGGKPLTLVILNACLVGHWLKEIVPLTLE